jgi:hypothetical protein
MLVEHVAEEVNLEAMPVAFQWLSIVVGQIDVRHIRHFYALYDLDNWHRRKLPLQQSQAFLSGQYNRYPGVRQQRVLARAHIDNGQRLYSRVTRKS